MPTHGLQPLGPRRARARRLPRWWSVFAACFVPSGCGRRASTRPPTQHTSTPVTAPCRLHVRRATLCAARGLLSVVSLQAGVHVASQRGPSGRSGAPGGRPARRRRPQNRVAASSPVGQAAPTAERHAGRRLCRLGFERSLGRGAGSSSGPARSPPRRVVKPSAEKAPNPTEKGLGLQPVGSSPRVGGLRRQTGGRARLPDDASSGLSQRALAHPGPLTSEARRDAARRAGREGAQPSRQ